jgi:hypothetical protein
MFMAHLSVSRQSAMTARARIEMDQAFLADFARYPATA